MRILRLTHTASDTGNLADSLFDSHDITVDRLDVASVTFLASMQISAKLKKADYSWIVVDGISDALAALSARKMSRKPECKVCVLAKVNANVPRGITTEISKNVDLWVFPSQDKLQAYKQVAKAPFKRAEVVAPTGFIAPLPLPKTEKNNSPVQLLWLGEISDYDRLRAAVEYASTTANDVCLHVCGTGRARYVMPTVQLSKSPGHKAERVVWHGDDYDAAEMAAKAHFAVATNGDVTPEAVGLMRAGVPLLEKFTDETISIHDTKAEAARQYAIHSPEHYVETLAALFHQTT